MKSTFSVLFYLRKNRSDKNGYVPLMAKITISGERVQFGINLKVQSEQWDSKSSRVIGRSAEATNLNRLLDNIRVKAENIYQQLLREKGYALPEVIKNILLGIETDKKKTLLDYFSEHNEQYKLKVGITTSLKTYSRYELTRGKLLEFMRIRYKISDIVLSEMNYIFIENFYLYLLNNSCNNNTAMKFVQRLRTIFTYAINSGADIKVNPFANFKFRYDAVNRDVLSQEEINTIYQKKFDSKRLTQVRDLFIFCCYTGLAYIDACKLTQDNICKAFDGNLWIMTKRTKTNVASNIRLLDIPLEIIAKYKGKDKDQRLIPSCINQKMNEYLKETPAV